jgi:hypothetical protein
MRKNEMIKFALGGKNLILMVAATALILFALPNAIFAAGVSASGGGTKTVGVSFTVSVVASGPAFNTVQGAISVSGPVSILAFNSGSADYWSSKPSNGGTFAAAFLGRTVTSMTVATITLKGTAAGNGAVSVSGVTMENAGSVVGTGASGTNFTIVNPPVLPNAPTVTSPTHPDPTQSYEATTITLNWNQESGVNGFSYLLDQAAGTIPPATITNDNTTVTYPNKAIGTYYFHIRAHMTDGFGPTTTFQINIKAPSPKVDSTLAAPTDIKLKKSSNYVNDITDGTATGVVISGTTLAGDTANISLTPAVTPPTGKTLSALADSKGNFSLVIDWPIPVGRYSMTVQGQNNLVLTPPTAPIIFEITEAKGGSINVLTSADTNPPKTIVAKVADKKYNWKLISEIDAGILIAGLVITLIVISRKKSHKL